MFDVESVIDQVPHSENSSSFVTFQHLVFICRAKEEGHDKDYKEIALSDAIGTTRILSCDIPVVCKLHCRNKCEQQSHTQPNV
jgi:hypothetical protein